VWVSLEIAVKASVCFFFFLLLKHIGLKKEKRNILVLILFYLFFLCSLGIGDYHKKNGRINSVWYSSGKMPSGKLLLVYYKGQMERNLFKLLPFLPSEKELVDSIRDAGS